MPNEPFQVSVDNAMKVISIRLKGSKPSAFYTEKMLHAYDGIDMPWLYNRLLDYRQFSGLIEAPDVERLADHWRSLTRTQTTARKIAVLTADALTPARAKAFQHLFPKDEIRTFEDLHTALDWLNSSREQQI